MVPKLIAKSIAGILILMAVAAALVWQVPPASAGFTPTPVPTETSIPPTATLIPSTATPVPPPATKRPPADTPIPPTATPTITPATTPTVTPAPLLPVTGGQASGPNNTDGGLVSWAVVLILLVTVVGLVIRQSARTKSG